MDREITKEERWAAKRKVYLKWAIGAGVIVVAVGCVLAVMRRSVNESELTFGVADRGTIETSVGASGRVVPAFEEIINSPISTRIMEVYAREGDSLAEGTPLLRLDLQSTESEINQLRDQRKMKLYDLEQVRLNNHTALSNMEMQIKVKEMDVNRKKVEVANERRLDSLGSGTGDRVREAELAYNTGVLELQQLRQQFANERQVRDASVKMKQLEMDIFDKDFAEKIRTLEDARIRSPRAATLTYINNQIGQQIGTGEKVAVISDLSRFKVDAEVADSYADKVSVGSKAVIKIGKTTLAGTVSNLTPLSKNGTISFTVKLAEDDTPQLRSGLKANVNVMCDIREDVVRIPVDTYFKGSGDYELWVQNGEGEIVKRRVRLGDSNFEYAEVVEGMKPGDRFVTSDMSEYENSGRLKLNK